MEHISSGGGITAEIWNRNHNLFQLILYCTGDGTTAAGLFMHMVKYTYSNDAWTVTLSNRNAWNNERVNKIYFSGSVYSMVHEVLILLFSSCGRPESLIEISNILFSTCKRIRKWPWGRTKNGHYLHWNSRDHKLFLFLLLFPLLTHWVTQSMRTFLVCIWRNLSVFLPLYL